METKYSILIVDDDPKARKTLSDILKAKGYKPITAATGKEALDRVKGERPAAALVDLKLEDISGLEVVRKLKECSPGTECIVITGYASKASAIEAVNLGAYGYVQKPYDMEQLLLTIRRAIEKREVEETLRKSELWMRSIFSSVEEAVLVVTPERFLLNINEAARNVFGYSKDELVGLSTEVLHVDSEHYREFGSRIKEAFDRGEAAKFEFEFKRKNGDVFPTEHTVCLLKNDLGESMGIVNVVRDITERKRAENELHKALSEIEQLKEQLQADYTYLQEEIKLEHNFDEIIGKSDALKYVLFKIEQVAPTDVTVLILGETGTGKELVARAIHSSSPRKNRPLVKVHCATLPSNLIESELFGYEKGAFTGAQTRRVGRFELANGATVFLDEICELPLELQSKLLRALQDGEFERLGSSRTIKVDVRIIAATNRNLKEEVRNGRFREDLYYRLNVFPITIPPLRQRKEDIPLLVNSFVKKFGKKIGKQIKAIPPDAMNALQKYYWPGNIRELENVIEQAVIISQGSTLRVEVPKTPDSAINVSRTLEDIERDYIVQVLEETHWKISGENGAAATLDLNPSTLRSRMKRLGIKKPGSRN